MFFHGLITLILTLFLTFPAQATAPLCSVLFEHKREAVDALNSVFESGEKQKILHVSVDRADNFSKILRLFKSRISRSQSPGFSIFLVSDLRHKVLQKMTDEDISSMAHVTWAPFNLDELFLSTANPSQHQISMGAADVSFVPTFNRILKLIDEGHTIPLEGIYIQETTARKEALFKEKLELVLEKTGAILYGVSSGSPAGLKKYSPDYEVAFAGEEVVEFSHLRKLHTHSFSLEESRRYVQQANLRTRGEFDAWEKHFGIPLQPQDFYRERGWQSWDHFLGYGKAPDRTEIKASLLKKSDSFEEAHERVRQLGFFRAKQYHYWWDKNRPEGLPRHPNIVYANKGWQSWEHFLGQSKWASHDEFFQIVVIEAKIHNAFDFKNWSGRPARIPSNPLLVYTQFNTWSELLRNPKLRISPLRIKIKSYQDVQPVVALQNFKTVEEYRRWKKPEGVPYDPDRYYLGKGWIDWPTFLGHSVPQPSSGELGQLVPAQN